MGPSEMARRVRDVAVRTVTTQQVAKLSRLGSSKGEGGFETPIDKLPAVPDEAKESLYELAASIVEARLRVFEVERSDMGPSPDWFLDPRTGMRAPSAEICFKINHRDWPGSLKHVWEPSRHQHLTALAAASAFGGKTEWSEFLLTQLASWWKSNPPFKGIHWTSGIEIGLRLISWTWIRRLLGVGSDIHSSFESNPDFLDQLYAHQVWLHRLPSHGTSANNHVVAEAVGQFTAACAFPLFPESEKWRASAAKTLLVEIGRQVGTDGVHRELATDYHAFVTELFLIAGIEGRAAGFDLGRAYWEQLSLMMDAAAAMLDSTGRPPRQGDSDDGHALVLDGEDNDRWMSLLRTGAELFGSLDWWPEPDQLDVKSALLDAMITAPDASKHRPSTQPIIFEDAGLTILRSVSDRDAELWCCLDAGPMGYLSTASHGHADALSIELRHDGVELFADPGTYCYQAEPEWRSYFRSIAAHNTLEIEEAVHARQIGDFMWADFPRTATLEVHIGQPSSWSGSCVRKDRRGADIEHVRAVTLSEDVITISDKLNRPAHATMRFHLGPEVTCVLDRDLATLEWESPRLGPMKAILELPTSMRWTAVSGRDRPPLGWYSPRFGVKRPIVTLEGSGSLQAFAPVVSRLTFVVSDVSDDDTGADSIFRYGDT